MTTHKTLEKLKDLLAKSTDGPWIGNVWTTGRRTIELHPYPSHHVFEVHPMHNGEQDFNMRLVVEAKEKLPALIEAIESLQEALVQMTRSHGEPCIHYPCDALLNAKDTLTKVDELLSGKIDNNE